MVTKQDLADELAKTMGSEPSDAHQILTLIIDMIATKLSRGEMVRLPRLGVFTVFSVKSSACVPPHRRIGFRPSAGLKKKLNS